MKMNSIDFFIKKEQLSRDESVKLLAKRFLGKAKTNLITMNILYELNKNQKIRELLNIPSEYDPMEWVAITGYYAMYASALALLAKIGFRSKNHTATLTVLEEVFVKKKILSKNDLGLLKNAVFQKEEIERISKAKEKREIAQYSVTKNTTEQIAEKIRKDAISFINKVEGLV